MTVRRGLGVALAVLLGLAGSGIVALPASAATTVQGKVVCVSQRSVVGVWIQAESGGSGWASWSATSGAAYEARYSRSLPSGGRYQVHVGCGGTSSNWASNNKSSYVGGTTNYFTCYDVSNAGWKNWTCQLT